MIRVMLRHIDEDFGLEIGKFAPDQINDVVQLVNRFRSFAFGNECAFAHAQFVSSTDLSPIVFFEIVVSGDES